MSTIASFPAVDHAPDPAQLIGFLDTARTLPGLRIAKSLALAGLNLKPGDAVADIGCGPGADTQEMAWRVAPGGTAIGVDTSQAMLAEARRRAGGTPLPIQFRQGKADGLPLASGEVDACRADTLLQHVPDPAGVIAEMTRVTRPGGRISVLEFDLGTLTIDHPDQATTGRLVQAAVAAFPDGRAGRGLRRLLTHAGLADVTVHTQFVEPDLPFLLRVLQPAFTQLSAEQLGHWQADLDHAWQGGTFTAGALVFVATARIPVMAARETSEAA